MVNFDFKLNRIVFLFLDMDWLKFYCFIYIVKKIEGGYWIFCDEFNN